MRPDEHKKKRSAQYKKKHGIKAEESDDSAKKTGKGKTGQSHGHRDTNFKDNVNNNVTKLDSKSASNTIKSGGGSLDSDIKSSFDQSQVEDDPVFRKRQVESNWARYEGLPSDPEEDEEVVTLRGADFKQMLDAAGESLSQFRFQDEKDWNVDGESQLPSCLSIDCTDLGIALACIPLHERLSIDESRFQAEEIEFFKKDAEISKQSYMLRTNTKPADVPELKLPSSSESIIKTDLSARARDDIILDDILGETGLCNSISISKTSPSHSQVETTDILHTILDNTCTNKDSEPDLSKRCETNPPSNLDNEEDDILDALLNESPVKHEEESCRTNTATKISETSRDPFCCVSGNTSTLDHLENHTSPKTSVGTPISAKTSTSTSHSISESVPSVKPSVTIDLEDELDSLLSLDDTPKPIVTNPKLASKAEPNKAQDGDDLEDWLDSILE